MTVGPAASKAAARLPIDHLLSLRGRAALVTGASGLCGAVAERLAEAGAHVVVHARSNRTALAAVVERIHAAGGTADLVLGDIVDDAATMIEEASDSARRAASGSGADGAGAEDAAAHDGGDGRGVIDVLVNGAALQSVGLLASLSAADVADVLRVGVVGAAELTRLVAARLVDAGLPGAVVNIASIEGLQPAPGHSHYAAAKAALLMHTRGAAFELGRHGIRVNAVAPGLIERPGLQVAWPDGVARWHAACPLGRIGQPDDVADAVLFLVADASRWITGATLTVDGGMLTHPTW